ncbi:MAG: NADH-quinone oxidoreductase subunit H [Bradymonadaceae bacterium]|nr:NADH-quinone oxidoreductase subunit H [Lujinxingiaceae bacterium]
MVEVLITVIKIVAIVFVFAMGVASLMTLLGDRKQSAKIQNRVGPNQAKFFGFSLGGIPHFIADGIKMILKENTMPNGANKWLHTLAPALIFFPALVGWAVIPFMDHYCTGSVRTLADYTEVCIDGEWKNYFSIMHSDAGLLFAFAIAAVSVYGAAIAGWASNNKFSLLGGLRSSAQMISYEVSMGLSLAGVLMIYGTLNLNEMVRAQGYLFGGWLPMWGIVVQPLAFFLFFLAGLAETKRAPFDLPEDESVIVAGYITEYSSMKFAIMQLSEYVATVFIAALIAILFLGGWQVPFLYADGIRFLGNHWQPFAENPDLWYYFTIMLRIGAMVLKVLFLVWLQFMMRWTLPRFRYDQVMTLGWKILLPLSIANLFITALILTIL